MLKEMSGVRARFEGVLVVGESLRTTNAVEVSFHEFLFYVSDCGDS